MGTKNNVAEILKDKPEGTKLYSPICGECKLSCVESVKSEPQISTESDAFGAFYFWEDGKAYVEGECLLFPSMKMRDWRKFAWKKGDVLKNTAYEERVIFDGFLNDDYTYFKGKHPLDCSNKLNITYHEECNCFTGNYRLESEDAAQTYIKTIEEKLGGKLNRETLKIEKAQPEFKDGDIVCISGMGYLAYGIVKSIDNSSNKLEYYALNDMSTLKTDDWLSFEDKQIQPITETQQIILFDALAKEGKAWDSEHKMIVNLKPKVEFKPFDKVLVRNTDTEEWFPGFFEKFDSTWNYPYHIMNLRSMTDFSFKQCIPYIGNESLLGTTKDVEG